MKTDALDELFTITCWCGHNGPMYSFSTTTMGGELPDGHWQCPKCGCAWRIEQTPVIITKWGTLISEPNKIIFEQAHL
jgi:hypothetical protein